MIVNVANENNDLVLKSFIVSSNSASFDGSGWPAHPLMLLKVEVWGNKTVGGHGNCLGLRALNFT